MQDIGGMDATTKEEIRESWAYLMEVTDEGYFDSFDMANLGRDLFMYCFYNQGFKYGYRNFISMCPVNVKRDLKVIESNDSSEGMSYPEFLYSILDGNREGTNINEFFRLFIANHSDDYRWAYRPYGDVMKALDGYKDEKGNEIIKLDDGSLVCLTADGNNLAESFTLDLDYFDNKEVIKQFLRNDDSASANKRHAFIPAIMLGEYLYIADNGELFNITSGDQRKMTYRRFDI
jgi:hypothetical protein